MQNIGHPAHKHVAQKTEQEKKKEKETIVHLKYAGDSKDLEVPFVDHNWRPVEESGFRIENFVQIQ